MKNKPLEVIIADMGATYSRVALLDEYQAIRHVKTYASNQFDSPAMVINAYLAEQALVMPDLILIAVAAPIDQDRLNLTNIHWDFSQQAIMHELNTKVIFLNDFEALSMALDHISDADLFSLNHNQDHSLTTALTPGAKLVIGTGTGFGTAIALTHNGETISLPSEGGHALYTPQDPLEITILQQLMDQLGRPIVTEDILGCKEGIPRLITTLSDLEGVSLTFPPTAEALVEAVEAELPFAIEVLNRYCMMLGNVASNLVLSTGATGGVYIGGGFAPRFATFLQQSDFHLSFLNKANVESLLKNVPIYLITHPYATLVGLQHILPKYL